MYVLHAALVAYGVLALGLPNPASALPAPGVFVDTRAEVTQSGATTTDDPVIAGDPVFVTQSAIAAPRSSAEAHAAAAVGGTNALPSLQARALVEDVMSIPNMDDASAVARANALTWWQVLSPTLPAGTQVPVTLSLLLDADFLTDASDPTVAKIDVSVLTIDDAGLAMGPGGIPFEGPQFLCTAGLSTQSVGMGSPIVTDISNRDCAGALVITGEDATLDLQFLIPIGTIPVGHTVALQSELFATASGTTFAFADADAFSTLSYDLVSGDADATVVVVPEPGSLALLAFALAALGEARRLRAVRGDGARLEPPR